VLLPAAFRIAAELAKSYPDVISDIVLTEIVVGFERTLLDALASLGPEKLSSEARERLAAMQRTRAGPEPDQEEMIC
jgi:hypothetical protein